MARGPASAVDKHPQRAQIIDALIAGKSVREVAKVTDPPLDFQAIQRYKTRYVKPVLANASTLNRIIGRKNCANLDKPDSKLAETASVVLGVRENRLKYLQDRHDRLYSIVKERGEEMAGETAGGASGLLARDYKGKNADTPVYKVDATLLSELREHERQVAIELGQWEMSVGPGMAIQIVVPVSVSSVPPPVSGCEVIDIALPKR